MRKAIKGMLIGLLVTILLVIIALPVAVPPLVEELVRDKLAEFGVRSAVRMTLGYCWRNGPGISGTLAVAPHDSPWLLTADFGASCCEWSAAVKMDETPFSENDPVLKALLAKYPPSAISNLTFSGSIALDARAERTFHTPVPVWSAKVPVRGLTADFTFDGKRYSIEEFSIAPVAEGIAGHREVAPMYPYAKSISANGFAMTNFFAAVRVSEDGLLITQASAELCGGKVNLYSLFLDSRNLNTGFTLFIDDVEAGAMLSHVHGFAGEASGRLHGKVGIFIREGGKAIRLGEAFLYSTPGETGKLRLTNPTSLTENLAITGIDEGTRGNVANALTDLDYSVLRLNLKRGEDGAATLSTTVRGTATRGSVTVPVDLSLNINGELEQLINTGLGYAGLLKGKQK